MSEFSEQRHQIYDAASQFMESFKVGADNIFDQMADAEAKFEEQTVVISALNQTVEQLQQENERITSEYQLKIDLQEQEITALRSQLGQKNKEFSGLSRTVHAMMVSARNIVSMGGHGFNIINRDAMSEKIVTQLRGYPQRPQASDGQEPVSAYAPQQRAQGR